MFSNLWFFIWPGGIFLANSWEGRREDQNWRPMLPTVIVFFVLFVIAAIQLAFLINAISGFGPIDPQHDMIAVMASALLCLLAYVIIAWRRLRRLTRS